MSHVVTPLIQVITMKKITEPEDIADKVVSRWEGEGGSVPESNEIRPDSDLTEQ